MIRDVRVGVHLEGVKSYNMYLAMGKPVRPRVYPSQSVGLQRCSHILTSANGQHPRIPDSRSTPFVYAVRYMWAEAYEPRRPLLNESKDHCYSNARGVILSIRRDSNPVNMQKRME